MRFSAAALATCCLLGPAFVAHAADAEVSPATEHAASATLLGPGESFGFQARWGLFSKAGRIDITADPQTEDNERRVTVRVASDGTIGRLYRYEAVGETRFAADSGRMQTASYRSRSGRTIEQRALAFDYEARVAHYRDAIEPKHDTTIALPEGDPVDLVTSLVTARRWRLAPGDSQRILVQVDDKFYPLLLRAGAIERVRTARGEFAALVVTPEPVGKPRGLFRKGGSLKIWLEDSPARLPVRVEVKGRFGTVTADLVHYVPPVDAPAPAPQSPSVASAALPNAPSI